LRADLERSAAGTVKRVLRNKVSEDFAQVPDLSRIRAYLETKTVWHPTGSLGASGSSY
jgi:hypothetical protein